jgi:hypothetical protein
MIIIPIGIQCTNATFRNNFNKQETLPFDWMFTTPKFVFEMLFLLLEENIDIEELVKEHFFKVEKRSTYSKGEHYYTCDDGLALYNTKYNVIFPHDINNIDTIDKYIRRFKRSKEIIILIYIYTSQSSLQHGNFTIDGNIYLKYII